MRVTALAGGTGAAKLVRGLAAVLRPADLTVIVNTGDDAEVWGLHVAPDLDTIVYALAGVLDRRRGWGREGETFGCLEVMTTLGADTWFTLGDHDLAVHLMRTLALRAGTPLSRVTAELARRLGVEAHVLPMSDHPVPTWIRTETGWVGFQEYFVRDKALPRVLAVEHRGASRSRPAPGVLDAILESDVVVVCPSNPVTSIGPILAVPSIVDALGRTRAATVAVSPIVRSAPVSGPAAALMEARGVAVSPAGVAEAYRPWLRTMVLDTRDRDQAAALEESGVRAVVAEILMTDAERERALAERVIEAAG